MPKIMYNKREYTGGSGSSSTLVSNDIILTLLETNWVLDEVSSLYKQSFNIEGITAEVNPIVGLATSDIPVSEEMTEAYSHIVEVSTEDGSITFYSDVLLTIAIPVVLKGVGEVEGSTLTDVNNLVEAYNGLRNDFNEIQWALEEGSNVNTTLLASGITANGNVELSDSLSNYQYLFLATNYNTALEETDLEYGSALIPMDIFKLGAEHTVGAYCVTSANINTNNWTIKYVDDTNVTVTLNNTYMRPRIYGIKDANVTLGTQSADDPNTGDTIIINDEWKLLGDLPTPDSNGVSGPMDLPEDYSEILIELVGADYHWTINMPFAKAQLNETNKSFYSGYNDGTYIMSVNVLINQSNIVSCTFNGSTKLASGKVYYKDASTHTLNPNEDGWKLLGSATGTTSITLPEDYSELMITSYIDNTGYMFSTIVNKDMIENGTYTYLQDGFALNYRAYWTYTSTSITLNGFVIDSDLTARAITTVYYKDASTHILNSNEDGWELIGSTTGQNRVDVDFDKYDEIKVYQVWDNTIFSYNINKDLGSQWYLNGYYYSNSNYGFGVKPEFENNQMYNGYAFYNSGHVINETTMYVYGIKNNSGVTISKKDVYSTEEREVGVDVDGSLIYEKTYYSDNCNIAASTILDNTITSANVKRVVDISEAYKSGGIWLGETRYVDQSNAMISLFTWMGTGGLQLVCGNATVQAYHITIRYVKA